MRVVALIIILAIGGVPGTAHAEKVKSNQSTKLYSRPGEQAKVLLKVKSGQGMTVVGKEGRWLKVRVQGRTGYVPRSKVDMPDDDEIARNTRRRPFVDGRSTRRGFGGDEGPDDRVGADALREGQDPEPKDSGDEEDKPPKKPHKTSSGDEEDKPPKKPHKTSSDDEEDKPPKKPHKTSSDDEEDKPPKKPHRGESDDEPTVVDDDSGDGGESVEGEKTDERPIAHVTEKTKVFSERDPDSDPAFTAKPSEVLFPSESKGKWTMVETEEGDAGWVMTEMLDVDDGGGGGGSAMKRTIDLRARLGVTFISQGMRSTGGTVSFPDNYNVGTSAVALALGGGILMPYKKNYVLGGDLAYDYNKAVPGIFYDPDGLGPMPGTNIGITFHNLNIRLMAGKDFHKKSGMVLLARLGYHYQSFLVDNYQDFTKNTARLPSEVFKAPTIGAALLLPKLTDKIGVRFSLDALIAGSVSQTQNLEDGKSPSAFGICFGGMFSYALQNKKMSLQGTYDLNYASYSFGGPAANSMRGHTGTSVARTDILHTLTFGITYGF